jgi:predicted MFS family arabinose efflux permease
VTDTQIAASGTGAAHAWREAPRAAKALIIGTFVNRMAGFLQIYIVLYLTARGFSAAAAAGALSAYGAGTCAGLLAGGSLADRFGVRQTIMMSMAGSAALLITVAYLDFYPAIVIAVGLAGAVSQAYRPAAAEMLSAVTPADRQVVIFSMQQLALNVGATTAPLLGVLVIGISYRLLFWGEATAAMLYAVIAALVLPRLPVTPGQSPPPAQPESQRRGSYLSVFGSRRYLLFLAAMLLNAVIYAQYVSTLPLFLRERGLPTVVYGALLAFNSVVVIIGQLPVTRLIQDWPPYTLAVTGILLTGLGMSLYAPAWGLAGLAVATLSWSVAECVATPTMFFAYPARAAPDGMRARYIGASQAAFQVGYAVGPAAGILVWRHAGTSVWWLCGLMSLVAALAAARGMRTAPSQSAKGGQRV